MNRPATRAGGWIGVGLALGLPALPGLLDRLAPPLAWALHPDRGLRQPPWHLLSCAWVHANVQHLAANLAALALVLSLGWTLALPRHAALAWALAWPLTHLLLLLDPRLTTYFGLSGVLHAGVGVLAIALVSPRGWGVSPRPPWGRAGGWALLGGLMAKCWFENPEMQALLPRPDLGMNAAPMSHWAGALAGVGIASAMALSRHHCCSKSPP